MDNTTIQQKVTLWNTAISNWPLFSSQFTKYTYPIGGYILSFLEGYLADTYGDSLKHVTDILRRAKYANKEMPMAAYVIVQAEKLEPIFRERLALMRETKIMTRLEHERCRSDYFGYLLTSNAEESKENFSKVLNNELALIGRMLLEIYGEKGLKPLVLEYVVRTIKHPDIAGKQFIIVSAIYLEAAYRQRFLPDRPNDKNPIRVKPSRFIYFVTEILPEKMRKLKTGVFSGLLEFMNDVRPSYMMIN